MPIDYLKEFPITAEKLPSRLRGLLEAVDTSPAQYVEVTCRYEFDIYGPKREYLQMVMAVVPEEEAASLSVLDEAGNGVVSYSVPVAEEKACRRDFIPSVSGYDYIVASWGDGSSYTYNLSEKVWMALGLSPRCIGNNNQRMIYDDLSLPEFKVAEGEISCEFFWKSDRNVTWKISNEYLRKYLWMRGAAGVRIFFYEALLENGPELREVMNEESHKVIKPPNGWYELDLREFNHGILLQVWATVRVLDPELCPQPSAEMLIWPGHTEPMTFARADALTGMQNELIFLDDRFLERYEQNNFYETTPTKMGNQWACSPSYRGQWSFTECRRVGRNLIRVSIRELYKPKPDREIVHAHAFALSNPGIEHLDLEEEHIVAKTQRLLDQLLNFADNLSSLCNLIGVDAPPSDLILFSREELRANGWRSYQQLRRLAQVAPVEMTQQAFLSRCKAIHELWQGIPNGKLRRILEAAGCPKEAIKDLGSIKLLQALYNLMCMLNANQESPSYFCSETEREGWNDKNKGMAALFLNNELRIADAHEKVEACLQTLQEHGFDTANLNQGYGHALDFIMDAVIEAFTSLNVSASSFLNR